jgi:hypothetical protein
VTDNPKIELTLNPNGVVAPTHSAATTCREVIDLYFDALAKTDLSKRPPRPEGPFFRFDTTDLELSATDRRSLHESWILSKAFTDLMRGVRASLEEAYLFIELLSAGTIIAQSSGTLDDVFAPFRKRAADLKFPSLLAHVNARLAKPLEFIDAYRSMQSARNCFEHRGGIVGKVDAPDGTLILRFPALRAFVVRNDREIELYPDFPVEAGEDLAMQLIVRERQFMVGEPLRLSAADFDEIAFACIHFANELGRLLPKSPPAAMA